MDKKTELIQKNTYTFEDLCDIVKILRAPGGCPWDAEQTHKTIRGNFIEEVYEFIEGIDNDDNAIMREELGDVLLQVVFHARIAEDNSEYFLDDVLTDICKKLIIRHPHVFADVKADTTEQVLDNWNAIKMQTKGQKTAKEALDGVSRSLPSLMRAEKISSKLNKYGHGFATEDDIISASSSLKTEEDIGKLLYLVTSYAKSKGIDPEKALYDECDRIISNEK
ncbi:MAG: MazG family protein [Clostridia bacterium]|nr:MazG family protein [Clostridia bacterium]